MSLYRLIVTSVLVSCICVFLLIGCHDDGRIIPPDNWVTIENTILNIDYKGGVLTSDFQLSEGLVSSTVYIINEESWCSGYVKDGTLVFDIEESTIPEQRSASSFLIYDAEHRVELTIVQGKAPEIPVTDIHVSDDLPTSIMINQTVDLAPYFTAYPDNASYKSFLFTVDHDKFAEITPEGVLTGKKGGTVEVTVTSRDEGAYKETFTIFIESKTVLQPIGWTVKTSVDYGYCPDGKTGMPIDMFDGQLNTYLSLVKPGKTLNGCTTPAGHILSFTIDCQQDIDFNYIYIGWRSTNSYDFLRLWGLKLYGSHDGNNFEPIGEEIVTDRNSNLDYATVNASYRFVKVEYTDFSKASGSSVQIAEFRLGLDYDRME